MRKLYLSSLLLMLSWLIVPVGWAQNYTAGFDTAPAYSCSTSGNSLQPNCFQITLNGVIYVFAFTNDGGGGSFLHINTGGVANGPSMDLQSTVFDISTGEKVTITRLDGGTFSFSSIFVDHLESAGIVKEPVTVQPFLMGVPVAAAQTVVEGGQQTLTFNGVTTSSVQITSNDFYYISLDNFSVCVPPSVSFNATGFCLGTATSFTNTSTQVLPGATYQWDFNNDDVIDASVPSPSFTYPSAGTYTAKLTIKQGGCVSSFEKQVTISAKPTAAISGGGAVCAGSSTGLSIALTGTAPWSVTYTDGASQVTQSNIQTSPYTFPVAPPTSRTYTLISVSNGNGTCTGTVSGSAPVTVNTLPAIVNPPAGGTRCAGEPFTLSVGATGTSLAYQWKKDGNAIQGATGSTYSFSPLSLDDAGVYTVVVSGACSPAAVSAPVTLTVNQPTVITSQPTDAGICAGDIASFTVAASNATGYQWQVNQGAGFTDLSNSASYGGATTATLTITGATGSMNGFAYRAVVTGSCAPSTSNVATLTVGSLPAITSGPTGGTVCVGSPFTLGVTATGSGLSYQWKKNGNNIMGANDATYNIASVGTGDAGSYTVLVTGACGTPLTSAAAVLNVNQPPSITGQPESATVCQGSSASFIAGINNATGYQWQVNTGSGFTNLANGGVYSGATTATLAITEAVSSMNGYQYRVVATSSCPPTVTSNAAVLSVTNQTLITAAPVGATKCAGDPVSFSVTATGSGLSYQWKKNGNNITGATNSTYNIASASVADAGTYSVAVSGDCGAPVLSGGASLTVNQAPAVTDQPGNVAVCTGVNASFTVAASNATGYQWQVNQGAGFITVTNSAIYSGATTATLNVTEATAGMDGYQYRVVVTSSCPPSVVSNAATLSVTEQTLITNDPAGATKCVGQPVAFSVTATGSGLSYQWKKNGNNITGATNSTYNIPSAGTGDAGSYTVEVTGACGTPLTSGAAVLNVNQPPSITGQPESATVCQGSSASFSVTASNVTSYQWQVNTGSGFTNLADGGVYSGATTATLAITGAVSSMNSYQYRVVATSSCPPSVVSNAATLSVTEQTRITAAPVGATKCAGDPVSFSVTATGSGLSYQWKKNGNNITGATNSTYNIASASVADAGTYSVAVSGDCGAPDFAFAELEVGSPSVINSQPVNVEICTGVNASFAVTASNATGYQWQVNSGSGFVTVTNSAIYSGATTATLNVTGATADMNGYQYRVVVFGSFGACPAAVISNAATLSVTDQTLITAAPVGATKCAGQPVAFSVTATGSGLSYQWKKNGNNITGATNSTYNIASASAADAGTYSVAVSGNCGAPVLSAGAVLAVNQAPAITSQPKSVRICTGANASFAVTASNVTSYQWQVNSGSGFVSVTNSAIYSGATTATLNVKGATAGMNGYQYRVVVTGHCAPAATSTATTLNVSNPTTLGSFTPLAAPVLVSTTVNMSIGFTGSAPVMATWNWNDGKTSTGVVVGSRITGSHVYATPGVYTPTLTVTSCGNCIAKSYEYVVVYDPNGGFITGGGWFNSPAGAYRPQPALGGRVNFGFVSKYKKGTTVPDGNTVFQSQLGKLKFHSTAYEWLVISGSKGQYKGSGTINGTGNYGFILTAIDGGKRPDRLRMKIWNKSTGAVVYDNQLGAGDKADPTTVIAGGSIMIKAPSRTAREGVDTAEAGDVLSSGQSAYPNPFRDRVTVDLSGLKPGKVHLDLTDGQGHSVHRQDVELDRNQSAVELELGDLKPGMYLLQARGNGDRKFIKLIKL